MEKTNLISCQLTYYPLGITNTDHAVEMVLKLITNSPVHSETNALNTIITGRPDDVFQLLKSITEISFKEELKFAMQIGISNKCGCNT